MAQTSRDSARQRTMRWVLSVVAIVLLVAGLGAVGRLLAARKRLGAASEQPG
jgi:hypothetical protein